MTEQLRLTKRDGEGRCPYCRDPIGLLPAGTCGGCGVAVHADCRNALARCPTIGCAADGASAPVVAPYRPTGPTTVVTPPPPIVVIEEPAPRRRRQPAPRPGPSTLARVVAPLRALVKRASWFTLGAIALLFFVPPMIHLFHRTGDRVWLTLAGGLLGVIATILYVLGTFWPLGRGGR